jgi:hypothetical protein
MSTGGLGMMDAISQRGMEAEVPLSKKTVYKGEESEESSVEESSERGMSMTVLARSMLEVGSMRSTRVPGGYNSSMGGLSSR